MKTTSRSLLILTVAASACVTNEPQTVNVRAGVDAAASGITNYIVDRSDRTHVLVELVADDAVIGTISKTATEVSMQLERSSSVCTLSSTSASGVCDAELPLLGVVFADPAFHAAMVVPSTCSAESGFGCTASAATSAPRCNGLAIFNYCSLCLTNDATSCAICGYCLGY